MARIVWRNMVPAMVAGATVCAALVLIGTAHWRWGSGILAAGTGLIGGLRLVLSADRIGPMAVRSKTFDVVFYWFLAGSFVFLALPG